MGSFRDGPPNGQLKRRSTLSERSRDEATRRQRVTVRSGDESNEVRTPHVETGGRVRGTTVCRHPALQNLRRDLVGVREVGIEFVATVVVDEASNLRLGVLQGAFVLIVLRVRSDVLAQTHCALHQVPNILGNVRSRVVFLENLGDLLPSCQLDVRDGRSRHALVAKLDPDLTRIVTLLRQFDDPLFYVLWVDVAPLRWFVCRRLVRTGRAATARAFVPYIEDRNRTDRSTVRQPTHGCRCTSAIPSRPKEWTASQICGRALPNVGYRRRGLKRCHVGRPVAPCRGSSVSRGLFIRPERSEYERGLVDQR